MTRKRPLKQLPAGKRRAVILILGLLLLIFPTWLVRPLANAFGHAIARGARIGFSFLSIEKLVMAPDARVGHFNLFQVRRLTMRNKARVGYLNISKGPISLQLEESASIGNRNSITRAVRGTTYGPAQLYLGKLAKITAGHSLDCTQSIRFGHYSTLAGKGSQIWTHGYAHELEAPKRYRVDGRVLIGNNVYLGSSVIVTGGLRICDDASIGVGTCVTKNLAEPGFYVSGKLRMLPKPVDPNDRTDLVRISDSVVVERVYKKHVA